MFNDRCRSRVYRATRLCLSSLIVAAMADKWEYASVSNFDNVPGHKFRTVCSDKLASSLGGAIVWVCCGSYTGIALKFLYECEMNGIMFYKHCSRDEFLAFRKIITVAHKVTVKPCTGRTDHVKMTIANTISGVVELVRDMPMRATIGDVRSIIRSELIEHGIISRNTPLHFTTGDGKVMGTTRQLASLLTSADKKAMLKSAKKAQPETKKIVTKPELRTKKDEKKPSKA